MSSNKKIRSRLNKLFDEIKQTEDTGPLPEKKESQPAPVLPTERSRQPLHTRSLSPDTLPVRPPITTTTPGAAGPSTLAIPFQAGNAWNLIQLEQDNKYEWQEDEQSLVRQVADQLGLALQNAQLYQETQKRASELATLNSIVQTVSEQIELKQVLETAYQEIRKLVSVDAFYITFLNEKNGMVEFPLVVDEGKYYTEQPSPLRPESYTGQTIISGKTLQIYHTPEEMAQNKGTSGQLGNPSKRSASLLFVPLKLGQKTVGCLSTQSYEFSAYSPDDVELIENITNQISIGIQNARLYEQEQYRRQVADTLGEIARIAGSTLDLGTVGRRLLQQLPNLIHFQAASIQLITEKGARRQIGGLSISEKRQFDLNAPAEHFLRPISTDPLMNEVYTGKKTVFISDTYNDPRWERRPETEHVRSWMCSPLIVANQVIGFLILDADHPNTYNAETAIMADSVAVQAAAAIQNARLYEQAQARAHREQLLREITSRVRGSTDPDVIMRTAVREIGQAMGMQAFIHVGTTDESAKAPAEISPASADPAPAEKPKSSKSSKASRQPKKAEGDK
jgi:GAF domain-containing protein